jgi:hypothetical protein
MIVLAAAVLLTSILSQAEIVDGGPTPTTARHGMHACPLGYYITGIDVGNNILLCDNLGTGYQESDEIVDNSSQDFSMHACPDGQVMSGFHEAKNLLLCVPRPDRGALAGRFIDHPPNQTVRQDMHACPAGLPMSGIHVGNNYLLCEYRLW